MNTEKFYSKYYYLDGEVHDDSGKTEDAFHETINLLPFPTKTSSSDFDSSVPVRGITGEFFRLESGTYVTPISGTW